MEGFPGGMPDKAGGGDAQQNEGRDSWAQGWQSEAMSARATGERAGEGGPGGASHWDGHSLSLEVVRFPFGDVAKSSRRELLNRSGPERTP